MTEHMFPVGGGTALAEAPAGMQASEEDSVAGENRKKLLVVLVAVGVLVAVVAAYFLMKSGGSSNTATGVVPGAHHFVPGAAGKAPSTSTASKPVTLPRQVAAPEGRNPFKALYSVPTTAPSTGTATSSTAVTSTSNPSNTTVTSTSTGGSSSSGSTSSTTQTYHPVWIQLKSLTMTTATFLVGYSNGKTLQTTRYSNVKAPATGKTTIFAKTFALLSIRNSVVSVRFGDGSPFQMDLQHNYMVVD
jgi:hypothetical protein